MIREMYQIKPPKILNHHRIHAHPASLSRRLVCAVSGLISPFRGAKYLRILPSNFTG